MSLIDNISQTDKDRQMDGLLGFWNAMSENRKAALFALFIWLIFGLWLERDQDPR